MKYTVEFDNDLQLNRIRYVLSFIQNHPLAGGGFSYHFDGDDAQKKRIGYCRENKRTENYDFFVPAQQLIFSSSSFDLAGLVSNVYSYNNWNLNSIETESKGISPFFDGHCFGFDVFEAIFFHLSRYEEQFCNPDQLDEHGRMKSKAQFLVKNGLEKMPVVDHLVFCFLHAIGANPVMSPTIFRMTFDIDSLRCFRGFPPVRLTAKYLFSKPFSIPKLLIRYFKTLVSPNADPYFNFDWLLRKTNKMEQVIYFLVGGRTRFDRPLAKLNEEFKQVVNLAKDRGLQVGLHPSYDCAADDELFKAEKNGLEAILGKEINQSRQHFLHFSWKSTPKILEKLGISEDSSIGYSDRIGFRCGTGFSYFPYSFSEEQPFDFKEMPMICMDIALMREAGNSNQRMVEIWDEFILRNKSLTYITLLFHNSRFFDAELEGMDLRAMFNDVFDSSVI